MKTETFIFSIPMDGLPTAQIDGTALLKLYDRQKMNPLRFTRLRKGQKVTNPPPPSYGQQ